eukprot:SAG22_NODE_608_length_8601_cov_24.764291_6_plen_107_part_00
MKHTGVEYELLSNKDMYKLYEKGIRGGISMISLAARRSVACIRVVAGAELSLRSAVCTQPLILENQLFLARYLVPAYPVHPVQSVATAIATPRRVGNGLQCKVSPP